MWSKFKQVRNNVTEVILQPELFNQVIKYLPIITIVIFCGYQAFVKSFRTKLTEWWSIVEKACGSNTEGPFKDHSEIVEQDQ